MTDKLTDKEIVKVLECCVGDNDGKNCFDCPLWEIDGCQERLLLDALDIINRLQVKNQRLTTAHPKTIESIKKMRDKAKAEAYKEFWEKLWELDPEIISKVVSFDLDELNNLKKELVGENNETKTF